MAMAPRLGTALLDLDVATGPLTRMVSDLIGVRDLDVPVLAGLTRAARYDTLLGLAEANLRAGRPRRSRRALQRRTSPALRLGYHHAADPRRPHDGLAAPAPTPAQEAVLRDHCAHARYVWNLAVEQHVHWRPGRTSAPGYREQCRQLTAARAEHPWLAAGSQMVQQQALRDFAQAMANYFGGTHDRPAGTRDSESWGGAAGSGMCAARLVRSARFGCRRPGGCGSAGPVRCRRA